MGLRTGRTPLQNIEVAQPWMVDSMNGSSDNRVTFFVSRKWWGFGFAYKGDYTGVGKKGWETWTATGTKFFLSKHLYIRLGRL